MSKKGVEPILRAGVRIFRPMEWDLLLEAVKEWRERRSGYLYDVIFNALLHTGMRYVEIERFVEHGDWFDREKRVIRIPSVASDRGMRRGRVVYLSLVGAIFVENFVKNVDVVPQRVLANRVLKECARRVGFNTRGISVKSLRRTWEAWLVASYPRRVSVIMSSLGDTDGFALRELMDVPFTDEDLEKIKEITEGWGGKEVIE